MSKGGRFHGRAEREREGSPLAEILRPRAIICPAGLFRLLARGWSPYLHTRPIYSIRRLPYQRFSIPVYIVSITRAWCLARRSEINETQAQKKKEVRGEKGEREEGEKGEYKNVQVAPRYSREAVDSHEVDPRT